MSRTEQPAMIATSRSRFQYPSAMAGVSPPCTRFALKNDSDGMEFGAMPPNLLAV